MVITCGMHAFSMVFSLLVSAPDEEVPVTVFRCVAVVILGIGACTGWRHVGAIDPSLWRLYLWALPLVGLLVLA